MALPKKGSRKIVVEDQCFRWIHSSKPNVFEIRAENEENPAQSLFACIPNQKIKRVTPSVVSKAIERGLKSGWDPSANSKKPFLLDSSSINDLIREIDERRPRAVVRHKVVRKNGLTRVRKFKRNGYENFRIRLNIEGLLDKIHYVEYELHPSFREPLRLSKDPDNGFPIEFWTWGEFEILVVVHYFDGHDEKITYNLKYSSELPKLDSDYLDETPINIRSQRL